MAPFFCFWGLSLLFVAVLWQDLACALNLIFWKGWLTMASPVFSIVLAADEAHALHAHDLVLRMCAEMHDDSRPDYANPPEREGFIRMVLEQHLFVAVFVAYDGDTPAGMVVLTRNLDTYMNGYSGVMKTLYVAPAYRKTGLAAQLVSAVRKEAIARRYKGLQWQVYASNMPSLGFFAKLGLKPREQETYLDFWLSADELDPDSVPASSDISRPLGRRLKGALAIFLPGSTKRKRS